MSKDKPLKCLVCGERTISAAFGGHRWCCSECARSGKHSVHCDKRSTK